MRTDSFAQSTLEDGASLTGSIGAGTTIKSFTVPKAGWWLLETIVSCDVTFAYYLRIIDTDASTVLHEMFFASGAGSDPQVLTTPLYLGAGQIVRLVTALTVLPAIALQGNILPNLAHPGVQS